MTPRVLLLTFAFLVGAVSVVVGVAMLSIPAAFIVAGPLLGGLSVLVVREV